MHDDKYECECQEQDCCCEHAEITVTISLDGEEDVECYVLGSFEVNDREYIALQPKGEDEAMIFRYNETDGEVQLENISSDDEYEAVANAFYDIFGETESGDEDLDIE